jgi:hypothetical protein
MTRATQSAKEEARENLQKWVKPGDTLYTVLRHVSRSGMSRRISVVKPYIRDDDGTIDFVRLDYNVAGALGWPIKSAKEGICVDGCGMDMGFHLIYELGQVLFGNGYALKQRWL